MEFSPCSKKFAYVSLSQIIQIDSFEENRQLSQIHPRLGNLIESLK